MTAAIVLIFLLLVAGNLFLWPEKIGAVPSGERLERIPQSPHYRHAEFRNPTEIPLLWEGYGYIHVLYRNYTQTIPRHHPVARAPAQDH